MATDMFLQIDGIKGESQDKAYKGQIDVQSWSWGMSNSGSAHTGGGQGAGKVNVQDLSFSHYIDKSTPDLMLACCTGKHIPKAVLTVRKAGGSPLDYLQITMEDLIVTGLTTGGSTGDDRLTETVNLNFAKVKVQYKEQTPTGAVGDKPQMGWDIRSNSKL
ncbi:MAG: type VI secretion system tube protein Hcp [Gemmataceae bacterium]